MRKRAEGMTQVIEYLPSKYKVLSSKPQCCKKSKKRKKEDPGNFKK
jgi:hypothetical protein